MTDGRTVVVVDDDPDARAIAQRWLEKAGHEVEPMESAEALFDGIDTVLPDVVLLDLGLPGMGGMEALRRLLQSHPGLPVVMLTGDRQVDSVVEAMQLGAHDYLAKPVERARLVESIASAAEAGDASRRERFRQRSAADTYAGMFGRSAVMRDLFRQIDRVARTHVTVLIHGESGTGKELVARALHDEGARREGRFVAINCAAIAESLQDSELFGHEKGAFTGADRQHRGCFERADGGTLFLDEVAELTPATQAKLLRVLQQRVVQRVGGSDPIPVDYRLVAASHQNLMQAVEDGRFREDLFFRIAVFELDVPPLRERGDDVLRLAETFLEAMGQNMEGPTHGTPRLSEEAVALLQRYPWPGNVRELQNALQRAVVVCREGVIESGDFPSRMRASPEVLRESMPPAGRSMDDLEREALRRALERAGGNVSEVVRELGIGRTTVYRKLKKYGLR